MSSAADWYYHRKNCETCAKSQAFLTQAGITPREVVDAKNKFDAPATLKLAKAASVVLAAKGAQVLRFDMKKEPPEDAELLKALLGPYGNLRAPAIRKGRTLAVGFNSEMYRDLFEMP